MMDNYNIYEIRSNPDKLQPPDGVHRLVNHINELTWAEDITIWLTAAGILTSMWQTNTNLINEVENG